MSIKNTISRTIKRLNLHGFVMNLPIFGKALYDGISCEFDRVNDFREIVKSSTIPNENMDVSTIMDNQIKYGIDDSLLVTDEQKIQRIIESATRDGNGGPDWIQEQIQKAGFPLYVILNKVVQQNVAKFGTFQFGNDQFGGASRYTDPATVPGEIVASSPNGNIGPLFKNFGSSQFGTIQFGDKLDNTANPRPKPFTITSDSNRWGYFFFLSPDPNGFVTDELDFLALDDLSLNYLRKLIIKLKHTRNWCILQARSSTVQKIVTTDGLYTTTTDGLKDVVLSDL